MILFVKKIYLRFSINHKAISDDPMRDGVKCKIGLIGKKEETKGKQLTSSLLQIIRALRR